MNSPETDIERRMQDEQGFLAALRDARLDALRRHARAGVPVVVWRDGGVTELPAEVLLEEHERRVHPSIGGAAAT